MRAEIVTHRALVLVSLLLDGPATAQDMSDRLARRTADLLTIDCMTAFNTFDRLTRAREISKEQIDGRGVVHTLTATGREHALRFRQVLACLASPECP